MPAESIDAVFAFELLVQGMVLTDYRGISRSPENHYSPAGVAHRISTRRQPRIVYSDSVPVGIFRTVSAGMQSVFRARNTAPRVSPVAGGRDSVIAVFTRYERSG